jgi:lysophospholipase L1-like esterase
MNLRLLSILIVCLILQSSYLSSQEDWKFGFGDKKEHNEVINILNNQHFSNETGYGFDFANTDKVEVLSKKNGGYCTASTPFYFSVNVPEGTYEVNITFGGACKKTETTVKAEAKRLMLRNVTTAKGEIVTKSITVNVRNPKIDSTNSIRLKPREHDYLNWDSKLSLEFSGKYPAIKSIEIKPKNRYTTLFLAGNSTVTDQDRSPYASWGQMITPYFNNNLAVANYAESGESLASFKSRKRLEKVLSMMKSGDYLFIEFGHNDQKRTGEGIGPWTSFTDLLNEFITKTRAKGGIPVLVTPTQRRSFNNEGVIEHTHKEYPDAMRKVAKDMNVPLIDLHAMTKVLYEKWGIEQSTKAFVHYPANSFPGQEKAYMDNSHFNEFGAHEVAMCILKGIIEQDLPIKKFLIDPVISYSPEKPNDFKYWDVQMSPRYRITKPDGN